MVDELLRLEVESLISSHESTNSFIETPAGDVAAEMLRTDKSRFEPGQQIDNYRIVRQLGAGGVKSFAHVQSTGCKSYDDMSILEVAVRFTVGNQYTLALTLNGTGTEDEYDTQGNNSTE